MIRQLKNWGSFLLAWLLATFAGRGAATIIAKLLILAILLAFAITDKNKLKITVLPVEKDGEEMPLQWYPSFGLIAMILGIAVFAAYALGKTWAHHLFLKIGKFEFDPAAKEHRLPLTNHGLTPIEVH